MNKVFKRMVEERVPRFNKKIVDGIVPEELRKLPDFINTIFRSSCKSFTAGTDVEYLGYRFISPDEEFTRQYKASSTKRAYDVAQTDIYPVVFMFKYKGELLEKTLMFPYAKKGNLMAMSGTERIIVPVMSDSIISPSEQQVFVRLYKDKITFKSEPHNFVYNGKIITSNNIWVIILKDAVDGSGIGDASIPPAVLYILGKYGFDEAVLKYFNQSESMSGGYTVKPGDVKMVLGDTTQYEADYNIYTSRKIKPHKLTIAEEYTPHELSIVVHKSIQQTHGIKNFIFGIIYAFDVLPDYAERWMSAYEDGLDSELLVWRDLLGAITYRKTKTVVKVLDDTRELFVALDNYIDDTIRRRLATVDLYVNDFYDLVWNVLFYYDLWSIRAKEYNMDISKRHMDVLYYMGYPYIEKMNRTIYAVNKQYKKASNRSKEMTMKEVNSMFNKELQPMLITTIVRPREKHFNLKSANETFNSNVYLACTSQLEDQGCAKGVLETKDTRMPIHCKYLNGAAMYFGSILYLSKSKPSINFRVNPFVNVCESTGKIKFTKSESRNIYVINNLLANVKVDDGEYGEITSGRDVENVEA